MKKRFVFLVFALLLVSFVSSAEGDLFGGDATEEWEKTQENIDKYNPLDEDGNVDLSKYKPFKTKAEERIDEINSWLEEHAVWLKVVFGMVPSITWHFIFNLWWMLFFFVWIVLNANYTIGLIPIGGIGGNPDREVKVANVQITPATGIGLGIFVIIMVTKLTVLLGWKFVELVDGIKATLAATRIIGIILVVLFVLALIVCPGFVTFVSKFIAKKILESRARKAAEEKNTDVRVIHKIVEHATKGS